MIDSHCLKTRARKSVSILVLSAYIYSVELVIYRYCVPVLYRYTVMLNAATHMHNSCNIYRTCSGFGVTFEETVRTVTQASETPMIKNDSPITN